jgi:hypothetical protein
MNLLPAIQKAGQGLPRFLLKRWSLLKRILQLLWIFVCVKTFLCVYLFCDRGRQVFLHIWPESERRNTLDRYLWMILFGVLVIEGLAALMRKVLLRPPLFPIRLWCTVPSQAKVPVVRPADEDSPRGTFPGKDERVAREVRALARGGASHAQCTLGKLYQRGSGVPFDLHQASYWYELAARQGHAEAQCLLGLCRLGGIGVPHDLYEAETLFRQSSAAGWAEAQYQLACLLGLTGRNNMERAEAVLWFEKAAQQGHRQARLELASRIPIQSSLNRADKVL